MLGVAVFGVAETFDAPADAQVADGATTPVAPRVQVTVDPAQPSLRSVSASDDGRIVALDTADDDGASSLRVVDRVGETDILDVPATGTHPGVSGDGCVVAYSESDAAGASVLLEAVDLCATPVQVLDVGSVAATEPVPAPAVSRDGAVIVWSTGDELLRFTRSAAGTYARDTAFAPVKDANRFFGSRLEIAEAGTIVVYETIADRAETDRTLTTVHVWQPGATSGAPPESKQIAGPGARMPTVDAAGDVIAYERVTGQGSSAVEIYHATNPAGPQPVQVVDAAWKPQLSADGHHLVYQQADGVHVAWWSDGDPFAALSTVLVMDTISTGDDVPTNSGPGATVSANGRLILAVGDQSVASVNPPLATGTYLWQHVRGGSVTAQSPVDLGSVTVGQTATGTVRFTNDGQVGIPLARTDAGGTPQRFAPVGEAGVTVRGWSCDATAVWQPGTSCVADVSMAPGSAGAARGSVRLAIPADAVTGAAEITATATVDVVGVAPSTTTSTTTTTTVPTTPPSTVPPGTVPTRSVFPLPSDPIFRGGGYYGSSGSSSRTGSSSSTGSSSTSGSGSGSTSSATTTTTVPPLPVFEPPSFEFAPTIIDAGRRTAEIGLFNPGPDPVTVSSLAVGPTTDFALGTTDCEGASLPAGGRCTVEVTFAPTAVGELEATLTAAFDDGRQATATVAGTGADSPVLTVEPEVATDGQVVSVFGAGFPAGTTVTLSWNDGMVTAEHTTDDLGDFSETLVVLPHTERGPTELLVPGQDGFFDDVTTELLIDITARRTDSAVFGELGR